MLQYGRWFWSVQGMTQIHTTAIVSHGNLNSHVCFVDARFNLKISDYGLPFFRKAKFLQPPKLTSDQEDLANSELYLWRAPELLRMVMPPQGTQVRNIDHFEACEDRLDQTRPIYSKVCNLWFHFFTFC